MMVLGIASIKDVYLAAWSSSVNNLYEREVSECRETVEPVQTRDSRFHVASAGSCSSSRPFRTRITVRRRHRRPEEEGSAAPAVNLVTLCAPPTSSY